MIITDQNGIKYQLGDKLGEGGQGSVYRVKGNNRLAIKVRTTDNINEVNNKESDNLVLCDEVEYEKYSRKIRYIESLNAVNGIDHIATPIAMLQKPQCGYIMRFMSDMSKISDHMLRKEDEITPCFRKNNSLIKKLQVLSGLAKILADLQSHGLVYSDISPGNIFVSSNPDSHEVWLIDLDNLHYAGVPFRQIGTPKYRAPEIARSENEKNTFFSDIYSFALVAYEYLTYSTPFYGSMSQELEEEDSWDETEPDDFADSGNTDVFDTKVEQGYVPYVYEGKGNDRIPESGIPLGYLVTERLQDLFLQSFCEKGRNCPQSRPSAMQWEEAFEEAANQITVCSEGHTHLKENCIWCERTAKINPGNAKMDQNRYFSIEIEDYVEGCNDEEWDKVNPVCNIHPYSKKTAYFAHKINDRTEKTIPGQVFDLESDVRLSIRNASLTLDFAQPKVTPSKIEWEYKTNPQDQHVMLYKNKIPFKIVSIRREK